MQHRLNPVHCLSGVVRRTAYTDTYNVLFLLIVPFAFNLRAIVTNQLVSGDTLGQYVPLWTFTADELAHLHFPFWNPYVYAGFPQAATSLSSVFYPTTVLFLFLPSLIAATIAMLLPCSICGAFLYLHLRDQDISPFSALIAGMAAALSGAMSAHMGHFGIDTVAGWFPAQLFFASRLIKGGQKRYMWSLAGVSVLEVLGGLPQEFAYAFIAVAVFGVAASADINKFTKSIKRTGLVALAMLLSIGLAAFYLLPAVQLVQESNRVSPSYAFFSEGSYPPSLILTLVSPWLYGGGQPPFNMRYWGPLAQYWWEGTQYVGVLALPLIGIAVWHIRADARVRVYAVVGLALFLLAIGSYTPIGPVLFLLPVYNAFHISARYAILFGPVLAALLAIGLDYTLSKRLRFGNLLLAGVVSVGFLTLTIVLGMVVSSPLNAGHLFQPALAAGLGPLSPAIVCPMSVLVIGSVLITALVHTKQAAGRYLAAALLMVLFFADLGTFAWFLHATAAQAPVLTNERLSECLGNVPRPRSLDAAQRVGYVEYIATQWGLCSADFAIQARQPTINGYDPLVPRRYLTLLSPDGYGSIFYPDTVLQHAPMLDVLGVRYLLAQGAIHASTRYGQIAYATKSLGISVQSGKVVHLRVVPKPSNIVGLVSTLANAANVKQGETVAEIRVLDSSGSVTVLPIRAGVETSEWSWDNPLLRGHLLHNRATVAYDLPTNSDQFAGHAYVAELPLRKMSEVRDIEIVSRSDEAAFVVLDLSLYDSVRDQSVPLGIADLMRSIPSYREITENNGVAVFENRAVMPRSWLVDETDILQASAERTALLDGILPDGRQYIPSRQALLEPDATGLRQRQFSADGTSHIVSFEPGRIQLHLSAKAEAFVVVSASYYPGWKLTIDGVDAPLLRADYTLMGFRVPAGEHDVVLWYDPRVYRIGLVVSFLVGAIALLGTILGPRLMTYRRVDVRA